MHACNGSCLGLVSAVCQPFLSRFSAAATADSLCLRRLNRALPTLDIYQVLDTALRRTWMT